MDLSEVVALHQKGKGKINLEYTRPSGRIGHCFIDCSKPLCVAKQEVDRNGVPRQVLYGHDIAHVSGSWVAENMKFLYIEVYKQTKGVAIWVHPEKLALQNPRKAAVVKTLYGTAK